MFEEIVPVNVLFDDTLGNSSDTSRVKLGQYRRAMFLVICKPTAAGNWVIDNDGPEEIQITLKEADAFSGGNTDSMGDAITFKAGQGVKKMRAFATNEWANEDTLTINGVAFEKVASGQSAADGTFEDAAGLKAAIDANIDGVTTAVDSTNNLDVEVDDPTDYMTVEFDTDETGANEEVRIDEACCVLEVHISELSAGKSYAYLTVDDDTATHDPTSIDATVIAILGNPYKKPVDQVVLS